MGNFFTQYNPFSVVGQYNIQTYLYENKRTAIAIITVIILIIVGFIIVIWTNDKPSSTKQHFNLPRPKYGDGIFGKGLYLPPKNMIIKNANITEMIGYNACYGK